VSGDPVSSILQDIHPPPCDKTQMVEENTIPPGEILYILKVIVYTDHPPEEVCVKWR
jgi:hypothetical protein